MQKYMLTASDAKMYINCVWCKRWTKECQTREYLSTASDVSRGVRRAGGTSPSRPDAKFVLGWEDKRWWHRDTSERAADVVKGQFMLQR